MLPCIFKLQKTWSVFSEVQIFIKMWSLSFNKDLFLMCIVGLISTIINTGKAVLVLQDNI